MSVPRDTIWEYSEHTRAKHRILDRYLRTAWFPKLGQVFSQLLYVDGFCGPGVYSEGEDGSPIIALRAATDHYDALKDGVTFVFNDADPKRTELLDERIEGYRRPKFDIEIRNMKHHDLMPELIERVERQRIPTFAFVDPFGYSGIPMQQLHRLLECDSTEVFINFNINRINQFVEHPEQGHRITIRELFGTDEVHEVARASSNRKNDLRLLYQRQLKEQAEYVRFFTMRDEDDRDIYDLFFAGNHIEGYDRMKDAMWTVDPEHGMRFSDATDPEQAVMFQENPIDRLLDQIYEYFGGQKMPLGDIYDWVAENTAYCRRQAKDAIREAELNRPKFVILNKKKDGQTRRKNTHPPEAIIDFGQIPPKQGDLF